ncbi:hypothetical protein [Mucilaginibacter flavus]|uniref:hypothetical protein n=1 Tax=Mucilaginibacter flavus TaxID=931504 RepID=UPI0025B4A0AD|nr:hypothetical protein [Mucilaginibacter flavus]MDN3581889.1 hypothetical protein [Mucilaginibacter flavus]
MKRAPLFAVALPVCLIFCLAARRDLPGRWTGSLRWDDSTRYQLAYRFTLIGDSVAGTASSPLGDFPIDQGRLDTAGLHFKVTVNGLDVYHEGTVYPDSIGMNITLTGSMVHCTLVRAPN